MEQTLTVHLEHLASQCPDDPIRNFWDPVNLKAIGFSGTKLRLVYKVAST